MEDPHGGDAMSRGKLRIDSPAKGPARPHVDLSEPELAATLVADPEDATNDESESAVAAVPEPHSLERTIQFELLNQPHVRFSSLVVRRFRDGICLQGVIEVEGDLPDIVALAQEISGVERVMNHLVVRRQAADD